MYKVLFVCTGNICRSPTGEALFRNLVAEDGLSDQISTDSCGMGSWHVGGPADRRTVATAKARGVDMSDLRARQIRSSDFEEFDLLLAMDRSHYRDMKAMCPTEYQDRIQMFLGFGGTMGSADVPDPYYGGASGFDDVFDMVQDGSRALLDHIKAEAL